jgi:hypothetical protein
MSADLSMTPTPRSLQLQQRRLARLLARKGQTLADMRNGAALHCQHRRRGTRWILSTGRVVDPEVASAVLNNPSVIRVGDALFATELSQTYRLISVED